MKPLFDYDNITDFLRGDTEAQIVYINEAVESLRQGNKIEALEMLLDIVKLLEEGS